jgi:hypothetical protein
MGGKEGEGMKQDFLYLLLHLISGSEFTTRASTQCFDEGGKGNPEELIDLTSLPNLSFTILLSDLFNYRSNHFPLIVYSNITLKQSVTEI